MIDLLGRTFAFIVCVLGLPFHLAICLAIRLEDGGPAIHRCRRIGRAGRQFTMLKYRTMMVGCNPVMGSGFKVIVGKSDPRVTRLGRFLRCGIDELPQIWNIVRGEMAWVGPRPHESWMLTKYGDTCARRLAAKPGITGLAQVLDSRNYPTAVGYAIDLWYIGHRALYIDLLVVCSTPLFALGWRAVGKGCLRRLMASPQCVRLRRSCEIELEGASLPPPDQNPGNRTESRCAR